MRDIVVIAIVGVFTLIALLRPVVGVLVYAWLGFFYPQSYTWGIARTMPLSQIVAIATVIGCFLGRDAKRFSAQRETILLLALWGIFGVSTLFAIYPKSAAESFSEISKILLMVLLTILLLHDEHRLRMLVRVVALSLGFYGLKGGIFVIVSGGQDLVYGPQNSFLEANNSIGLALAMNVPLLYFLFRTETRPWLRWLIAAMLLFSYPAVVFTYSRGAWIGLAMATALLFLRMRNKVLIIGAAGTISLIVAIFLPHVMPQRLSNRYDTLVNYEQDDSAESRFWNWEFCKRVGMARPLTGGGFKFSSFENYAKYYPEFLQRWPGKQWTCHSLWFTVFGEHGFPGFLLWLALLISCFLSLKRVRIYGKAHPEMTWMVLYADCVQSALVSYLIVGTFLDAAYFDLLYYLVAMIVIAKEMTQFASRTAVSTSVSSAMRPVLVGPTTATIK